MNVLVTGGAGYVGFSLVRMLDRLPEVDKVVVYDNLAKGKYNFFFSRQQLKKTSFVQGDVLNSFHLEKVLADIDVVYHLAGAVSLPYNHEEHLRYEQVNRWGTSNLYQSLIKLPGVKKVIFLSSAAVYGFKKVDDETVLPEPENAYGRSKLEAERFMELLNGEKEVTIFRSANVFGFNRCFRMDAVLNQFFFEMLTYNRIQIYGNGEQYRPFVEVEELAARLVQALTGELAPDLYNVVEFNANLNDLRDILLEIRPGLEYVYINQNQTFPSIQLSSAKLKPASGSNELVRQAFERFREQFFQQ